MLVLGVQIAGKSAKNRATDLWGDLRRPHLLSRNGDLFFLSPIFRHYMRANSLSGFISRESP